ncbi:biotin carboxylase N-terminal domain-containing protein [Streptomyces sp. URMC 123]|uniref:acetyl/propionyl/methylcrotonyl-CoA carboxylase subunit alpha n=1 Tax=Streptomyces sp. URMC 123 TaxID=3423403 RepID=UPI003F1BE6C1
MIGTLLVANRGEIARRVFRTCRDLGIATVAVYAEPDAGAAHAREADAAVLLPGTTPADTYLRADALVRAARAAGADAVHPGYGFLSEDAGFARAVLDAGLTWVGPPPEAMAAMASKTRAKRLLAEVGAPLLAPVRAEDARTADLPLLVKAAAGGGGRGMRIVRQLTELPEALDAARAEAAAAFGDPEVFLEPYIERGRHVEVQILADTHGTVWAVGTRDCSLQRRHQKVVEEAPAPGLPEGTSAVLCRTAVDAARALGYTGAGTVEFLLAPDGRPYVLEINTRLQVEHPVTECVHGIDLVAHQIAIAEGERLPPEPPPARGHAVEARLYAEDPAHDWQPRTGPLHRLAVPEGPGLRLDSGVTDGDEIGPHYDPLLAKVVAWAPTRARALRKLAHALRRARVHGPVTNRDLLVRALRHADVLAARADTGFLERHRAELAAPEPHEAVSLAALAAALADAAHRARAGAVPARLGGWRNLPSAPQVKSYRHEPYGAVHEVRYRLTRDGPRADDHPSVRPLSATADRVVLDLDGIRHTYEVAAYAGGRVHVDTATGSCAFTVLSRFPEAAPRTEPGSLLAPMPGTVVRVADLAPGDRVRSGQPLLWLEAMKMEHRVSAPASGTLTALHAAPGHRVEVGTLLAVVQEDPS